MDIVNQMGPQVARFIESAHANLKTYRAQAKKLSIDQFETDLFTQIGSDQWQAFVASAHALSQAERTSPPYPHDGDHCLLCRQVLSPEAIALVRKFWQFLEDDSRHKIKSTETALAAKRKLLTATKTDFFGEDSLIYHLIEEEDSGLLETVKEFLRVAGARKEELISFVDAAEFVVFTELNSLPVPAVRTLIEALQVKLIELQKSDPTKAIAAWENELRLLRHRKQLGPTP
jgi:GTPase SAR1 family protein